MNALALTPRDEARVRAALVAHAGVAPDAEVAFAPLAQHASNRSYHRVTVGGGRMGGAAPPSTFVVMKLGPDPLKAEEATSGPAPTRLPFVALAEVFAAAGLPVPCIICDATPDGFVLLEDLGDVTFEAYLARLPRASWSSAYAVAARLLARFHAAESEARAAGAIAVTRRFDPALLRWELEHFREWGLVARGITLSPAENAVLDAAFTHIVARVAAQPVGLSHRDYQSRNLMVQGDLLAPHTAAPPSTAHPHAAAESAAEGRLRVIDFQDALMAPVVYDLVALLRDSYVVLSPAEVDHALAAYRAARATLPLPSLTETALREDFRWTTVQRKLKDSGRFVFIERVKGDPSFLRHIPASLDYVRAALRELPELDDLRAVLERHLPEWQEP